MPRSLVFKKQKKFAAIRVGPDETRSELFPSTENKLTT